MAGPFNEDRSLSGRPLSAPPEQLGGRVDPETAGWEFRGADPKEGFASPSSQ